MYAVRDKKSKKILHVNPAPLTQELEGTDVYFEFDARTMEIGRIEGRLPEHFEITSDGRIVELSLQEKVTAGIVTLRPDQKLEGGNIVQKSLAEKVADGLLQLEPEQKVEGDRIVAKTTAELLEAGILTLEAIKQKKRDAFSTLALSKRAEILPDYKIQNALMGIYDDETAASYKRTVEAFRNEFHRLEGLIAAARSLEDLDGIEARFPQSVAKASHEPDAAAPPQASGREHHRKGKTTK